MKTPLEIIRTPCRGPKFSGSNGLITLKLLSLAAHPINRADDWPYYAPDAKSPAWAGRAPRQQVPLERFLHTYLDPDVRSLPWYFALLLVVAIALPARAATLAS